MLILEILVRVLNVKCNYYNSDHFIYYMNQQDIKHLLVKHYTMQAKFKVQHHMTPLDSNIVT